MSPVTGLHYDMKRRRWLVIGMLTSSVLTVLAVATWWVHKARIPVNVFTIHEPVRLGVAVYLDGGTISVWLVDKDGRRLDFCADARDWGLPGYGGIYTSDYPDRGSPVYGHPGAVQLADGGPEQAALYRLLMNWMASPDAKFVIEAPDKRAYDFGRKHVGLFARVLQERLTLSDDSAEKLNDP